MSTDARNDADAKYMRRAIQLSRRGFPAPNPHVGCVLVKNGEVVGEGYHKFAGSYHAEVEALRAAGSKAEGATAYVTLEPCNHHGRQPPCSDALIAAGIERVVVACQDPNPVAAGGLSRLAQAGIKIELGLLQGEAGEANEQFLTAMRLRRPFVVLKAAASLDGRTALPSGESKWLTGEDSRKVGHRLRAECGAVLVGRRTVEADNPLLTSRIRGAVNQPVRIVLDPKARLNSNWRVFDSSAPTIHVVEGKFGLRSGPDGFDIIELCQALFEHKMMGLLVEGGAQTTTRFVQARVADRVELFVAPKLLGDGPSWVSSLNLAGLAYAPILSVTRVRKLKADIQVTLRPESGNFQRVENDRGT